MSYSRFASAHAHAYARRNGYKGSYDEYVSLQYRAYADGCRRCDVRPMARAAWDAASVV